MGNSVKLSVPGKIVISGEYAVLNGAPAIVATTGIRAKVSISKSNNTNNIFLTSAIDNDFPFDIDSDYNVVWLNSDPGIFGSLLKYAFKIFRPTLEENLCISIDSSKFFLSKKDETLTKLGIGSSAAVSVGITRAFSQYLKLQSSPATQLNQANTIHQNLQNGLGSGIDVVSSFADQRVIECTKESVKEHKWSILNWPSKLYFKVLKTYQNESTQRLIKNYQKFSILHSKRFEIILGQLLEISQNISFAWKSQSINEILDLLVAYDAQLKKVDHLGNIGIYTTIHKNLQRVAGDYNVFYKPSGAGGGDIGIALSPSPESLNGFLDEIDRLNWNIDCLPSKR